MLVSGTLRAFFSLYNISISKSEPGIISEFSLLIFARANIDLVCASTREATDSIFPSYVLFL